MSEANRRHTILGAIGIIRHELDVLEDALRAGSSEGPFRAPPRERSPSTSELSLAPPQPSEAGKEGCSHRE